MPGTEDPVLQRCGSSVLSALTSLKRSSGVAGCHESHSLTSDRLAAVADEIKRTLGCEAVGIRLIDEDGNATYQVQDGFPDDFSLNCQSVSLYRDDCMCTRLLNNTSHSGASFFNERESFMAGSACEFQSVLLCRIRFMDMNLGLIHCADTRPRRFSSQSARRVEDFADTISRSLFYDSLWMPAVWASQRAVTPTRAACSICGRYRNDQGKWFDERRLQPRISWSVLRVPRIVCPHCLQFSSAE
jgi:hypothetical protein